MNTNRKNAIIVGVLFILAAVTAIIGLALYGPILPSVWGVIFALPVFASEMSLAVCLIVKGFNSSANAS